MATNEDINIKVHSEGGERAIGITPEQTERGIGINNESIVVRSVKSYNDLDDKPQINSVELEGDKSASDLGFADVAMSGSYNDLTDTPEIPAAQVNSDWNADSGVAEILNKPTIPTKTSQLDNDSGFLTSESDPVFSASAAATITSQDITGWDNKSDFSGNYDDLTNKPTIPTKTSQLTNDGSDGTSTYVEADELAAVATSGSYSDLTNKPTIPTKTSDLTNDGADNTSVYVEADELAAVAMSGSYNDLSNKPTIPAAQVNSDWNANSGVAEILNKPTIPTVNNATLTITQNGTSAGTFTANASSDTTISLTDTTYSDFSGATSSAAGAHGLVPAPSAGDQEKVLHGDGTWKDAAAKLVEMSYGESNAWAKFIAAYNAGSIVYCRASSNANPATGSQTRKAFMAYVNSAESPTSVEFQYVRSVSSKTASQPVDQVFVYTLTNASGGTWTVASRNMGPKLAQGTNTTVSYSNGTYTISATQPTVPTVVQTTGQSTTDVMSQKAVTDIIGNVETILQTLNNGGGAQ